MPLNAWNERIAFVESRRAGNGRECRRLRMRVRWIKFTANPGLAGGFPFSKSAGWMSRLDAIHDWPVRARLARYKVRALAKNCGASSRQLRRFFLAAFRKSPECWLMELRLWDAARRLCSGGALSIKEIAAELGFASEPHFCRAFKSCYGCTASEFIPLYQKRRAAQIAFAKKAVGSDFDEALLPPPPWVTAEANLRVKVAKWPN